MSIRSSDVRVSCDRMSAEREIKSLVDEFVRQLEAAFRRQLDARLFGASGGPRKPLPVVASIVSASAPEGQESTARPSSSAPKKKSARPVVPGGDVHDTLVERVYAFISDNQDRIGEDEKPIRIQRALIAERLGVEPELAGAVLDHLVGARRIQRQGERRGAHYMTSKNSSVPATADATGSGDTAKKAPKRGRSKGSVIAEIQRQVAEGLARREAEQGEPTTSPQT